MKKIKINPISMSSLQLPGAIPLFTPLELVSLLYIPFKAKNFTIRIGNLSYIIILLLLCSAQAVSLIFTDNQANFLWFLMKYTLIIMCFSLLIIISKLKYSISYYHLKIALTMSVFLGLLLAPSYIFFGPATSIIGICTENNLFFLTGHLRCSTFGEGNYYGIYLSTILVLFHRNKWILFLCTIGMLISMSKIGLVVLAYIYLRKLLKIPFAILISFLFLLVITLIEEHHIRVLVIGEGIAERTSFGERLEFIRIGIRAFLDHPIFGVGAGQFHLIIAEYTNYQHLLQGSNMPNIRFIPNNVIVELLAEFGIIGGLVLMIPIFSLIKNLKKINKFSRYENIFLILLIGMAQPTFFILSNFVIYGVAAAGGNNND